MPPKVEPASEKMLSALSKYCPPAQERISSFEPEAQEVIKGLQGEVKRLQLESDRQLVELIKLREDVKELSQASPPPSDSPEEPKSPKPTLGNVVDQHSEAIYLLAKEVVKLKNTAQQGKSISIDLPPLPEWNDAWFSNVKEQWLKIYATLVSRL
ncbi:MAG TPA: hypothetical protein V6D07_18915 [Trichocoleus sp.]